MIFIVDLNNLGKQKTKKKRDGVSILFDYWRAICCSISICRFFRPLQMMNGNGDGVQSWMKNVFVLTVMKYVDVLVDVTNVVVMTVMNLILFLNFFFNPKNPNRPSVSPSSSSSLDSTSSSFDEWITDPDRTEILRSLFAFLIVSLGSPPETGTTSGMAVVSILISPATHWKCDDFVE